MNSKIFFILVLLLICSLPSALFAEDLTSTSFIIRDPVLSSGGGYGTSTTFRLFNSIDNVFTNYATSTSFIGEYGFLYFPSATPTPTPTPTPAPGGGGGAGISAITPCGSIADFNCDGHVDLLDFSIFLYYMEEPYVSATHDLNNDGALNLKDISIIFYYWSR